MVATKEATVGWRYHKRASHWLPLLIHFNCCSSCTAGYDILLNKTILKLSLVPQIIKIDTFTSNYTKIFPFFHIKIHNKIWGFSIWPLRLLRSKEAWKNKCPNFKSDTTFTKKNNWPYSQKCNWNVCEMHHLWNMI